MVRVHAVYGNVRKRKIFMRVLVLFFTLLFVCANISADSIYRQGKVADLLLRTGLSHYAILYIEGFGSVEGCGKHRDHVVIAIPDDDKAEQRYGMLLAAYMAGKELHVSIDPSKKEEGFCIIQDLRLNSKF